MSSDTGATRTPMAVVVAVRILASGIVLFSVGWVLEVPRYFDRAFYPEQLLGIVYGLGLAAAFLNVPAGGGERIARPPWYDYILSLVGLCTPIWVSLEYERLLDTVALRTPETLVVDGLIMLLTLEALRRTTGYFLLGVVVFFILYALVGHLVPGDLTATYVRPDYLLVYLTFDPSALLGTPLRIATTVVIAFILMGQLLFKSGGGVFFTDLAAATTGRTRGGAAKVSVIASALFGTISGSPASNVTSTGVITIPLMKKAGYRGIDAGAIEAVASTGGQFMPPIMGAAAFLMAEFLEISYAQVVVGAIIPSLLYYLAVFIQVDLIAARDRMATGDVIVQRTLEVLRAGWHFVVPFAILIWMLFYYRSDPELAALYAAASIMIGGLIKSYKGQRLDLRGCAAAVWETGVIVVELLAILAGAGLVIGVLNITGAGFALTLVLINMAGGSMVILLAMSAVVCIILGMGMPTTAVYVLLAALIAPALVEAGIPAFSAHLFILYYGMLSMITPPIALACFAASVLTREDPMKTAMSAMRFGWVAYVIPFMFVLSPTLLLEGEITAIAINFTTAAIGVYFFSMALVGYFKDRFGTVSRVLLCIAGVAVILPTTVIPYGAAIVVLGLTLGASVLGQQILALKRRAGAALPPTTQAE